MPRTRVRAISHEREGADAGHEDRRPDRHRDDVQKLEDDDEPDRERQVGASQLRRS